jgi:hypothetical protein
VPVNAIAFLINSRGEVFTRAVEIALDPHPERGARKGLTSEGGAPVAMSHYVRDSNGVSWCLITSLPPPPPPVSSPVFSDQEQAID